MSPAQWQSLQAAELDAVLGRNETAVLALARADEPYAIPVSYGYDPSDRTLYLQLVSGPDSEKHRFLDEPQRARLVVSERREDAYRSVVAVGTLAAIARSTLSVEQIHQYGEATRPLLEIWSEADGDIQLYELAPERLTGRRFSFDRSVDAS